jgi:hypothetical protein
MENRIPNEWFDELEIIPTDHFRKRYLERAGKYVEPGSRLYVRGVMETRVSSNGTYTIHVKEGEEWKRIVLKTKKNGNCVAITFCPEYHD